MRSVVVFILALASSGGSAAADADALQRRSELEDIVRRCSTEPTSAASQAAALPSILSDDAASFIERSIERGCFRVAEELARVAAASHIDVTGAISRASECHN